MKHNTMFRVGVFALMLICLYSFSLHQPIYALAIQHTRNANDIVGDENNILTDEEDETSAETLKYSPLRFEEVSERSQFEKRFMREDGAFEAVMYSYPVHFYAGNEWQNIDNTLVLEKIQMVNLFIRPKLIVFRQNLPQRMVKEMQLRFQRVIALLLSS